MKTFLIVLTLMVLNFTSLAHANTENSTACSARISGGDAWPWSIAMPFPWANIEGYWKLGSDQNSFLSAQVLSSTSKRKILRLSVYDNGICSKPYAKGTGYIDATEKNVVRALVTDGVYQYQLKLAMFDSRDVVGLNNCDHNVMGASMRVIGRSRRSKAKLPYLSGPNAPEAIEPKNMMLKKVTIDTDDICKKVKD